MDIADFEKLEAQRGLISRSKYVVELIKKQADKNEENNH